MRLNEMAREIHENAKRHGWWDEPRSFGEIIALCHSELSEALEEYRDGKMPHETYCSCKMPDGKDWCVIDQNCATCEYAKPEGIAVELADCIIRILDYCGYVGIDIEGAIRNKHEYNKGRPYKHGNKRI